MIFRNGSRQQLDQRRSRLDSIAQNAPRILQKIHNLYLVLIGQMVFADRPEVGPTRAAVDEGVVAGGGELLSTVDQEPNESSKIDPLEFRVTVQRACVFARRTYSLE